MPVLWEPNLLVPFAVQQVDAWEGADSEPAFLKSQSRLPGSQAGQPWCQKGPFWGQKSMLMSPRRPEATEEGSGATTGLGCPLASLLLCHGALPAAPGARLF